MLWLGKPAIYWWDEARLSLNALEMMHPANPLIVTYKGQADLWNTKPPLSIWLSALSMRLFGINELALRLPSALAAIGTTIAVFVFTKRVSNRRTAYLAALILLGTGGFDEVHVTRTADFDSLLVLFTTLTTFSLFFAFDSKKFYPSAAYFAGGLMTKGVAGLMMAPGYALYAAIYRKDIRPTVLPGLAAVGVVLLFYFSREIAEPGYLHAVWLQDVARFHQPADGHRGSALYYLFRLFWPWQILFHLKWTEVPYLASAFPWSWIALLAMLRPARPAIYLFCCLGAFLLAISVAATHLAWYVAPAYPLIAVLTALGVDRTAEILGNRFVFPFFAAVGVACICLNIWKTARELETLTTSRAQRQANQLRDLPRAATIALVPDLVWRAPAARAGRIVGTEPYFGPLEFYIRQRPRGAIALVCGAEGFRVDGGRAKPDSCDARGAVTK